MMSLALQPALALLDSQSDAIHLPMMLLLVFGTAKLFGELAARLKQPAIVGEIIAGVLLGPGVLNWVQPNQVLSTLADIGLMFLLFRVGLEVSAADLLRVGRTAALVAVLGVIVPFVSGWAILSAFGAGGVEAVFAGAAMVATSVGITAHVLKEKGLLSQRASQIILAAAVIDDVLGLLVLAAVSGLSRGHVDLASLVTTAVLALGFVFVVIRFGTSSMRRIVPRIQRALSTPDSQFNFSLVLLFALSVLASVAGMAAIVGAFFAGMVLSKNVQERVHTLASGVSGLLVPFFLAGIGLRLDIASFGNPQTLLLCGVLTLAAVLSKAAACGFGALSLGREDALRVAAGMIPRGEVGIVVAQIGLAAAAIDQRSYACLVAMTVLTTILAPPLLNLTWRGAPAHIPDEQFTFS